MYHEHARPDRDDHVDIRFPNIDTVDHPQFEIVPNASIETKDIPYDYGSVMHYRADVSRHVSQIYIRNCWMCFNMFDFLPGLVFANDLHD